MSNRIRRNQLKLGLLSTRQADCVKCLVRGCSIKEIAEILHIQPRTVRYHLFCAMERYQAKSLPQVAYYFGKNEGIESTAPYIQVEPVPMIRTEQLGFPGNLGF
jgi:DNA-binding NarL/FixJ family response regulator